ncbi:hypothetical protein [Nannocystis pusilla]|uniref:hypothetical protein n=1 Tax=Nannocystis pusilla TaxID=889268 RepID=UPI003B7DFB27
MLQVVDLSDNDITQIAAIADDPWLSECDDIYLEGNPLDAFTLMVTVPELCAFPIHLNGVADPACRQCIMEG